MPELDDLLEKIDQKEFVRLSSDIRAVFHQHQHWFNSLNLALITHETTLSEEDYCCCAHTRCAFGQWIQKTLDNPIFRHPFFFKLEKQHKSFHKIASQLINDLNAQQPLNVTVYKQLIQAQQMLSTQLLNLFEFSVVTNGQFDAITGLMNRRSVNAVLAYEKYRMSRNQTSRCCIALVDIDHFKLVNDTYGHDIGDYALAQVASILQTVTRQSDTVSRFGGEEFLFVLPDISLDEAITSIERVRRKLAETPLELCQEMITITASFGITQLCNDCDIEHSIKRADEALYLAKHMGRNRSGYVDIDSFSEADRLIALGEINPEFQTMLSRYCKLVNSEL
ncbi:sensor domain-containing diguanylate cyclase [uncultured Amphritea sp.]|uniref:sensor domain-containing diguanylate cyclase n=1 Tax=uncultured Amphritea sp. TaxID=981605 RepID=UPI00261A1605|nr:sensor domain-containing diguanylate cyclase [uncultured Amphritea sp.]